ncbi:hypothetical protein SASPL_153612 [Salvia splendens]|uniref:Uncharacterized protein n=1 Tax=Salvia splendens TaxID=180675 RepID=A0A8X8YYD7_SALSN|nr:uncharacterized protein LOC121787805 [Salvia splendens]KAG6384794.1 hypothetical protein SASPL_153612 [Salvia splendens]
MPLDDTKLVKQLEGPMPWIGAYAAMASTLCTLAMAADIFHGLRSRKYWFPSKYFSLNSAFLSLLAVAMKLPVDLTTKMYSVTDRLAKVSSLAFMSVVMANFLTSLGSMDNKSLVTNVLALSILVITIAGNVCIQIIQMRSYLNVRRMFLEESVAMGLMLLLLIMVMSSALTIMSTKQYLEARYHDTRNSAVAEEESLVDVRRESTTKLRVLIKKYWVMAETSSPQFVIARSVTSTVSGIVSLTIAVILVEAVVWIAIREGLFDQTLSSYKESTIGVVLSHTIGVVVGTVAPASRWLVAIRYRTSTSCISTVKYALTVEDYWTLKLVEWRQRSLSAKIQHLKSRKILHALKGLILELSISTQHLIVRASKLVLAVSTCATKPIKSCLDYITSSRGRQVSDEVDLRRYVIQLDGEAELPAETLSNILKEVDANIKRGQKRKTRNLLNLLSKSHNFKGVTEFDSNQVPPLHPQQLPYCWSLPVATLACIAQTIPNVEREKSKSLIRGVIEGLRYVKFIDKLLDSKSQLAKIRAAADAVTIDVEFRQNKDLSEKSLRGKNAEEILNQFHQDSKAKVDKFVTNSKYCLLQNRAYWTPEAIADNAMYRMSKTILLNHGGNKTHEQLFETISIMIADILAACLTNLPRAITIKCHRDAIEEREKGVRKAAKYLGETVEIIELLQQREFPILDPNKAAYIEEWRALIGLEDRDNLHEQGNCISINIED